METQVVNGIVQLIQLKCGSNLRIIADKHTPFVFTYSTRFGYELI